MHFKHKNYSFPLYTEDINLTILMCDLPSQARVESIAQNIFFIKINSRKNVILRDFIKHVTSHENIL